jgi:hypothetical protein
MEICDEIKVKLHAFLLVALHGSEYVASFSRRFSPGERAID